MSCQLCPYKNYCIPDECLNNEEEFTYENPYQH